jgi:hypothetical protein
MSAASIAHALSGRKRASGWTARCPAHDDRNPSLSISISKDGKTLVHCHAGCSQPDVIAALAGLGLWNSDENRCQARESIISEEFHDYEAKRRALALEIWNSTMPANSTLTETYLAGRAITLPIPDRLRFHNALAHTPTGSSAPAMVALVTRNCAMAHRRGELNGELTSSGDKAEAVTPTFWSIRTTPQAERKRLAVIALRSAHRFCERARWSASSS